MILGLVNKRTEKLVHPANHMYVTCCMAITKKMSNIYDFQVTERSEREGKRGKEKEKQRWSSGLKSKTELQL